MTRSRARIVAAAILGLMLVIFLPPFINANRFRARIATSISRALNRHVTVGSVSVRLFPQPGFDLRNLVIGEDPDFGAEPMLHADEVQASLRLSSLWRGHLEIAKLSLSYPSLNLVRAADGRWNVEALLQHASQIPTAPTTKARPESRPRFPYIEAENGRINFKVGQEKKVYALADADFALWLEAENELRTRLAARMVRTDSYLSDTGTLKFNGRFQRASNLRDTPLDVTISLQKAQLGQLTKLMDGNDRGWRGAVDANVVLGGTPAALKVVAEGSIEDFRRYDISSVEKVSLDARCTTTVAAAAERLSGIDCNMPLGNGVVTLKGDLEGFSAPRSYNLSVTADKVPAQVLVSLVRHAKKDIPDDLSASGTMDAAINGQKPDPAKTGTWLGGGKTSDLVLRSNDLKPELALKEMQFTVEQQETAKIINRRKAKARPQQPGSNGEARVVVTPFLIQGTDGVAVKVGAAFYKERYEIDVQGESRLPRLLALARVAGLRSPEVNAEGTAKLDLAISGNWSAFAAPKALGTAQLQGVTAKMKGIASPLQIGSATVNLGPDVVVVPAVTAGFADSRLNVVGSLRMPRQCEAIENCPIEFDMRADQMSTDELNQLFNPRAAKRPWYAILGGRAEPSIFSKIQAKGRISAGRVTIKSVVANHVSAAAQFQSGQLLLSDLRADLLGGKHNGQWKADFRSDEPSYSGNGTLDSVAMAQLSSLMRDGWAAGTVVQATYKVSLSGLTPAELADSAKGSVTFDWRSGVLKHIALNGPDSPLSFRQFSGAIEFRDNKVTVAPESKLTTQAGIYQVSGTASMGRQMDLKLRNGSHAFSVTGTLEKPKVTPAPETEAQVSLRP